VDVDGVQLLEVDLGGGSVLDHHSLLGVDPQDVHEVAHLLRLFLLFQIFVFFLIFRFDLFGVSFLEEGVVDLSPCEVAVYE